jgi:acetolactate synthase I/II/III large subunit
LKTFAETLVQTLENFGVRYIFGIPSGPWTPFMEAMRRSRVEFVLVSNEASAGFMADVCARLIGTPGVCYGTFGPGATNLSTGVVNALLDRSPVIALTSQVPTAMADRTTQMKIDHQALFAPMTKWTTTLSAENLVETVSKAFAIAMQEVPGPVHLGIPSELGEMPVLSSTASNAEASVNAKSTAPESIQQIETLLRGARKPIVALGLSATRADAQAQITQFIETQQLPTILTPMAKGLISEESPYYAGVLFHALSDRVAETHREADLVVAIGYDVVEFNYEEWLPDAPLIHIDIAPADIDSSYEVHEVVGDIRQTVESMARLPKFENDWCIDEIQRRKRALFAALSPDTPDFSPHHALNILRDILPRDGIMACDVGAHTHLIGQLWKTYQPGNLLMTNGGSSMGFGIPAAIAAKLCEPNRQVACVTGDGGFLMMVGEMATASRLGVPVVFVLLTDRNLQLIKIKQERKTFPQYGTRLYTDAYQPATGYFGVPVLVAENAEEYRSALTQAFAMNTPVIVEAIVNPAAYDGLILRRHK